MRLRQACLIIVVGGAVLLAGSFLHWFHKYKFWKAWPYSDFKIMGGVCLGIAAAGAVGYLLSGAQARQRRYLPRLAGAAAMMVAGAAAAVDLSLRQALHRDAAANGVSFSTGIGFWLMLVGAAVLVLGGLVALLADAPAIAAVESVPAQPAPVQPQPVHQQPVHQQPVHQQPVRPQAVQPQPVQQRPVQPQMAGIANGGAQAERAGVGAAAPGWYDDPSGRYAERYWDGTAWTERTR